MQNNASLKGTYAAAVGMPISSNPYPYSSLKAADWASGWLCADNNRKKGRDPTGDPPGVPHLCTRDVRAVCNCNTNTRANCVNKQYPEPATGLLRKLIRSFTR